MYITLYYIVTRLPDSIRVVRDHFLSVCPTTLTVDLLEKALLAAEKSIVAVGASRGDPRTPIFEGCSPSPFCPLSPLPLRPTSLVLSRSVRRLPLTGDAALARARGVRARVELAGAVEVAVEAAEGVGVAVGVVAGVEVSVAAVEAVAAEAAAVLAEAAVVAEVEEAVVEEVAVVGVGASQRSSPGGGQRQQQQRSWDIPLPQQLREWYALRQRGGGFGPCTYVLRSGDRAGEQCGGAHPTQRCFGRLTDAWRQQFPEASEIPHWGELSRAGVAIYDLDFDAILDAMYAVTISDEGDCYRCFPPNPGIGTAALGGGEAAALGASAFAPSGAGECVLSGTTSASASLTFTLDLGASRSFFRDRTTLTPLGRPVAVSLADPSGGPVLSHFSTGLVLPVFPVSRGGSGCSSLLSVSPDRGPAADASHGRVGARPASVDKVTSATSCWWLTTTRVTPSVFPLRSKGDVTKVLIDWIRAARLQLRTSFGSDFPVLRLHSDRGGEFSSGLLRAYCRARGIRQTFTLPDSPQQNGIAERRIGMVMDVARTSMMHAAAPHFLWPFAVQYAAHQINLHAHVSMLETSPALLWTGKVGECVCVLCLGISGVWWQFYHPSSRRVLPSQDVTFDESVPYYRLFPYQHSTHSSRSRLLVTLVLLRVLSLGVLTLGVLREWVLSLGVLSLGVLRLGVLSLGVLRLGVLRLELLSVGVLRLELLSLGVLEF
ncbi:unnamed protein product [Closterium sp. NIES-64]|nr:unnamed protein product [Closterium sp. NIES-64]